MFDRQCEASGFDDAVELDRKQVQHCPGMSLLPVAHRPLAASRLVYDRLGCFAITTVFSHAQTVVLCGACTSVLCQPTGGKARLTEGTSSAYQFAARTILTPYG